MKNRDWAGIVVEQAVRHPGPTLLGTVVVVAALALLARNLTLDALPDVTPNQVQVLTRAPGLSPEEVERLVTTPVEAALGGAPGLVLHRSVSRAGLSAVTAIFHEDVDPWRARQIVAERTNLLDLPEGIDRPELGPHSGGLGEVLQLTLRSDSRSAVELYELARLRIAPVLRSVPGVVEVNTWGGARRALAVVADPHRLVARGVTLEELRTGLLEATGAAAGGVLDAGAGVAHLRATARPLREDDLCHAIVRAGMVHDAPLRVCDVADVAYDTLPRLGAATADGKAEVVYVMAQMLRDENALEVTGGLQRVLPRVRAALPEDVVLDVHYDRSELVTATLRTVGRSLLEGGFLVVGVLLLLLGSVRAGLVVAVAIPLSMLAAAGAMAWAGIPGNLMSLGAIDFGIVVDGSVVIVERMFHALSRHRHDHAPYAFDEAELGAAARSVARPVVFAVLVIVAVYLPVLALTGVDGKMFRPMALTMVFALVAALAFALTTIPALAASVLRPEHAPPTEPRVLRWAAALHDRSLALCARRPLVVAVVALAVLGIGGVLVVTRGTEFIPQLQEGDLVLQTTRSPDIDDRRAVEAGLRVERLVRATPEVRTVISRLGSPVVATDVMGLEQGDLFIVLKPAEQWRPGLSRDDLIAELSDRLRREDPGAELAFTQPIQMRFNELVGGDVNDVAVAVTGEDLEVLMAVANDVEHHLQGIAGIADLRVMSPPDVPLVEVRPRPMDAARAGLHARDVLDAVAALRLGLPVGATWRGPLEVPLVLRFRATVDAFTLGELPIVLGPARQVLLKDVADIVVRSTPALIVHGLGRRRIVVGFNVRGRDLGDVAADVDAALSHVPRKEGVELTVGGQIESMREASRRMTLIIPAALLLVLLLLMAAFGRLRPALIILVNVPFAVTGGIVALTLRDLPISMSAAIGFIALAGVAVLNGVVLMDDLQHRETSGVPRAEAALAAARRRLRPVLMTAGVAALGFVPMMIATGTGAEVQRPLATVVVGGLVTSTLLTLLVLPALYPWLAGGPPGRVPEPERRPGDVDEDPSGRG